MKKVLIFICIALSFFSHTLSSHLDTALAAQLYSLLIDTQTVFEAHHLTYCAAQNTTLGALRHQGLIPWQKARLGLIMFQEDESNFLALRAFLDSKNIYIKEHMVGWYKLYRSSSSIYDQEKESPWWFEYLPNIDLYVMQKFNEVYHFTSPFLRHYLANYYFVESELKVPFIKHTFGKTTIPLAHDADNVLIRAYGAYWKDPIYNSAGRP